MQVFNCLPKLIAKATENISNVDVVTIDVFDTLFVRRVHEPDIIKKAVARFICNLSQQLGVWTHLMEVEQRRDQIEHQHRQRNGATHPDFEANYDEFMAEVLQSIWGEQYTTELFDKVAQFEIQMENTMLVPRADIVEFIKQLTAQNKRVILLSDIYLPSKYIKQMVQDKGLEDYFEAVISSADTCNAKASGAGFERLKQQLDLDTSRWMHIGDNAHSDGLKPTEAGIDAYVIEDLSEKHRKGLGFRYYHYAQKKQFWKGRYVQQLMLPLEQENQTQPALYVDGYNTLAYMLGFAMLRLQQRVQDMRIRKVYFCSREGWLFKQCWELMAPVLWPQLADKIEVHYLYVSRVALAKASRANSGLTLADANIAFGPAQNKDFNDLARVFGLNKQTVQPFLEKYQLAWDETISPLGRSAESYGKFFKLLHDEDFNQCIKKDAQADLQALENYLQSEGFFTGDNIALVDIGWLGTIQHYLTTALQHRQDSPCINGFMLAADRQFEYKTTDKSRYEGLLYDRMKQQHATSVITFCKDVLEEITRANHSTLLAYELPAGTQPIDGQFHLKMRDETDAVAQDERIQFDYYRPVHQGIFDGVQRFSAAVAVNDFTETHLREWLNFLCISKFAFPTTDEIVRLKNQSHQDDFAGGSRKIPKAIVKQTRALWQQSERSLKYLPLLRLKIFLAHMRRFRGL